MKENVLTLRRTHEHFNGEVSRVRDKTNMAKNKHLMDVGRGHMGVLCAFLSTSLNIRKFYNKKSEG